MLLHNFSTTTNTNGEPGHWHLNLPEGTYALKAYAFGSVFLTLNIRKGAASYQIYHNTPTFCIKMRLWEFDDDICDSTA